MYDHIKARQENLFRKTFRVGQRVYYPHPTKLDGYGPHAELGTIFAESLNEPGRWFVQGTRDKWEKVYGPFYPDQLIEA